MNGNIFKNKDDIYVPLFEAKMGQFFNHRAANVIKSEKAIQRQNQPQSLSEKDQQNPSKYAIPYYWVYKDITEEAFRQFSQKAVIGVTNVTSSTNARTYVPTLFPRSAYGHSVLLILFKDRENQGTEILLLLGQISSFVFDFIARQKLGGVNMTYFIQKQLPILSKEIFNKPNNLSMDKMSLQEWILFRLIELVYTAWDLESFAKCYGFYGPPFRWDEKRRYHLRCELDAIYFYLYEINRDDVDYIMETFPIVKRKDEQKYGNYRTKLTILEIYDKMQEAIDTGKPYQTILDPPPADPSCAHPPQ